MDKLKFIAISGTTKVTQNLYVYEYLPAGRQVGDIIVIDCGVGFPEEQTFGVDLVIPDFSYLISNKHKVKGLFVPHGHEDHYGAIPFLLQELSLPIYTTKLTAGFVKEKLADYNVQGQVNIIDPDKDQIRLGSFTVQAFRVTHSVPDSIGFCITTPVGKIFHVSDYKFDWTPVDQRPFDVARAAKLAQGGVLMLASDCLGATSEGYTKSELEIEKAIELLIEEAPKRIFFTTISSNISRMRQAINASRLFGRKVAFVGKSIETKSEIAKRLGFISWDLGEVVSIREAQRLPANKVTYIISGCYGQVGSALYRLSVNEHQFLGIERDDVVIFSADPSPPGTEQSVNYVVNNLIEGGAEVHYYDTQEDLHVSGHGSQKELEMLIALVQPKYLIPIGGTARHMRAYTRLAEKMGLSRGDVFELREGEVIEFTREGAKRGETIPVKTVFVDALGVGDVGNIVLRDRKTLAREGIVIVVMQIDKRKGEVIGRPDLISRGFVFVKEQKGLLDEAVKLLLGQVKRRQRKGNGQHIKEIAVDSLERFFFERTGRRPMILPVVVGV